MKALYELKDKLQDELDEIARKPESRTSIKSALWRRTAATLRRATGRDEAPIIVAPAMLTVVSTMSEDTIAGTVIATVVTIAEMEGIAATMPRRL